MSTLLDRGRWLAAGLRAWITGRPGTRPRRIAERILARGGIMLAASPGLKRATSVLLRAAPGLEDRLRKVVRRQLKLRETESRRFDRETAGGDLGELARTVVGGGLVYLYVDHTVRCPINTGVQRVVRGLASGLVGNGRRVRFVKWSEQTGTLVLIRRQELTYLMQWNGPQLPQSEIEGYSDDAEPEVVPEEGPNRTGQLIVPEITHLTYHDAPVTRRLIDWSRAHGVGVRFVFYDAIPILRAEFAHMAADHRAYMTDILDADTIWPISQWSAAAIRRFSEDLGRGREGAGALAEILPVAVPADFGSRRPLGPALSERMILCVGTLEPRKNQLALIKAFRDLVAEPGLADWTLVLVGQLHADVADAVRRHLAECGQVQYLGHVSDGELSNLYARCAFSAFPSVEEGFGLPILESVWHGRPCLCADFGAMGEVAAGGGCLTVDVTDPDRLADGMRRLMTDGDLRRRLQVQAASRLLDSWRTYAEALVPDPGDLPDVIYYWIDGTIGFPKNTGIQRVARQLARSLMQQGHRLIPVKWGGEHCPLQRVTPADLARFAEWNGPSPGDWTDYVEPAWLENDAWFVMSELPLQLTPREQRILTDSARDAGLKLAAVFYDTIPWKLRELYPYAFSSAHRAYMIEIARYDRILPISRYSEDELKAFLTNDAARAPGSLDKITACALPAEFATRPQSVNPKDAIGVAVPEAVISLLCVGTVEARKNHLCLVQAYQTVRQATGRPLRLVIVGQRTDPDLRDRLLALIRDDPTIRWDEEADDEAVEAYYRTCDFTIYASFEEGFGLPILESLFYGKPCICADFGAMREVAEGGGCVTVDVRSVEALAGAIQQLVTDPGERRRLSQDAAKRRFPTWGDYAAAFARQLPLRSPASEPRGWAEPVTAAATTDVLLSVCISTYDRADWLSASLQNWVRQHPAPIPGVELVICDNASTDHTAAVVAAYRDRADLVYRRNPENVGMLGNLRETAAASRGRYVWILGDDDLLVPGAVARVVATLRAHPGVALVYLNYAFTHIADVRHIPDQDAFFSTATPIVPGEPDRSGRIREICARNENFFTAIYTLVLRRDHAIAAYSQDTRGAPFTSMLTCIPTTHHVLHRMMEECGVWIGDPLVVVNMNVSWIAYAPIWILERIPEVYDVALARGVAKAEIDRWRRHTLPSVAKYFEEIYRDDPLGLTQSIDPARLVRRFADLDGFAEVRGAMFAAYARAHARGHPGARVLPETVFATPGNPSSLKRRA